MICDTGIGLEGVSQSTPMVSRKGKSTFHDHMQLTDKAQRLSAIAQI